MSDSIIIGQSIGRGNWSEKRGTRERGGYDGTEDWTPSHCAEKAYARMGSLFLAAAKDALPPSTTSDETCKAYRWMQGASYPNLTQSCKDFFKRARDPGRGVLWIREGNVSQGAEKPCVTT
ncbi:predicted protein [Coccidioides posadasii str. Silveira]|uniref:Predicted protein n=2 Tax=Coccidioides posadasii TaxID=199306 RepID=E9CXV7_COCPS|nr:predicted protein [Coccidioides posadasii str. Silveira]KMM72658.1 hypothetical protein CPAG_08952 [Coccidioides posadasii RMSCC 3488]